MIRLITGRAEPQRRALSTIVYDEIGQALAKGTEKIMLIVPEQYTLGAEQALIARLKLPGLIDAEVLSLQRLGYRVLEETGGSTRQVVDDHGRQMLLTKCLHTLKGQLNVYGQSASQPGFLQQITALIGELKENAVTVDALEKTAASAEDDRLLTKKLQDLCLIYQQYESELGAEREDTDSLQQLICEKIPFSEKCRDAAIWIDGFFTFTAKDWVMIEALAKTASTLTMTLSGDCDPAAQDAAIFALCRKSLMRLDGIAQAAGQGALAVFRRESQDAVDALSHLEQQLFCPLPQVWQGSADQIAITQCADPWEEARWAAGKIIGLLKTEGLHYSDITILCGSPSEYGRTLSRVFALYGIPTFCDDVAPVSESPLAEAVLAALEAASGNYARDALMAYGKSGFASITPTDFALLENASLAKGITGRKWEAAFDDDLESLRAALITPLTELKQAMRKAKITREMIVAAVVFLNNTSAAEKCDALAMQLTAQHDHVNAERLRQFWEILMDIFDQLNEAMGDLPCDIDTFSAALKNGLRAYTVGVLPQSKDVVRIIDPYRSRGGRTKFLFVMGAQEGVLPETNEQYGILTGKERELLSPLGLTLQDQGTYRYCKANYALYTALTSATEGIYFSYTVTDDAGDSLRPSPMIDKLIRIFPQMKVENAALADGPVLFSADRLPGCEGLLDDLIIDKAKGISTPSMQVCAGWFADSPQWQKKYLSAAASLHYQGVSDKLPKELVRSLYHFPMSASISRIEKYAECPFRHFLLYGLKPEPRPEYEAAAPAIGSLVHSVLDQVFKQAKTDGLSLPELSDAERERRVEAIFTAEMAQADNAVFDSSGKYRFLSRKLKRMCKKTVKVLSDQLACGSFEYRYSEKTFEKALQIAGIEDRIRLHGIIDRIDIYVKDGECYVRVIDYKTGKKTIDCCDIYYGLSFQLLIYIAEGLSVVQQDQADAVCVPAGTFYFHADDPMIDSRAVSGQLEKALNKKFTMQGLSVNEPAIVEAFDRDGDHAVATDKFDKTTLTRDEFAAIMDYAGRMLEDCITGIYDGNIAIAPYLKKDKKPCTYCEYKSICQLDGKINRNAFRVLDTEIDKEKICNALGLRNENDDLR